MKQKMYKIITFAPSVHSTQIRKCAVEAGATLSGAFRYSSIAVGGVGTFISTDGAHPVNGIYSDKHHEEVRMEFICPSTAVTVVVNAIESVHPDDDPVIDTYPLLSL